jgi:hypothetical protein
VSPRCCYGASKRGAPFRRRKPLDVRMTGSSPRYRKVCGDTEKCFGGVERHRGDTPRLRPVRVSALLFQCCFNSIVLSALFSYILLNILQVFLVPYAFNASAHSPPRLAIRQGPTCAHALTEPAFEPATNRFGLAMRREKDMYVAWSTSSLDELPLASFANIFDFLLCKNALICGKENWLAFHLIGRHLHSVFAVYDNWLAVGFLASVHCASRVAVEARTVCSERDVIRQR